MDIKEITFATDHMQFHHPEFLWALFLLAIPIAIHLFNLRRYKTVYFSDIRFLKNVQKSSKRQKRLKEWLVLLTRCLMITALVLAFAKPFLPVSSDTDNNERVVIVLDNSASASILVNEGSYFEENKKKVRALLNDLPTNTEVAIITARSTEKFPNFGSIESAKQTVEELQIVDRALNVVGLSEIENSSLFIFSDFQENELGFITDIDSSVTTTFFPPADIQSTPNLSIDSTWTEAPFLIAGQPIDLFVKVKNYSFEQQDITFEVSANGLPELTRAISIKPEGDTTIKTTLTQLESGFNQAQINLANDPVQFDNRVNVSFYLPISNTVIELYEREPSALIERIFDGSEFEFQSVAKNQVRENDLQNADLIILNELNELSSGLSSTLLSVSQKANLLIIPNQVSLSSTNDLLSKLGLGRYGKLDTNTLNTERVNKDDPFFKDVFAGSLNDAYWPTANKHYKIVRPISTPSFDLLTLVNGDPLLLRASKEATNVFQLAVPLDESFSDIANHPVIIPLFIKALMKKGNIGNLTGITGTDRAFNIPYTSQTDAPLALQTSNYTFIPQQRSNSNNVTIQAGENIDRQGTYDVLANENVIGQINFNIEAKESDLRRLDKEALDELISQFPKLKLSVLESTSESFATSFKDWQIGIQYWRHFLLVALIFVLVEVILLRFLK